MKKAGMHGTQPDRMPRTGKRLGPVKPVIMAVFALALSGCDVKLTYGNRSGDSQNDYVEEPIPGYSEQYKPALETSNKVLDLYLGAEYQQISDLYVVDEYKGELSPDAFRQIHAYVTDVAGAYVEYLPDQWGFVPKSDGAQTFLYSFKIVRHEKEDMHFVFVFSGSDYSRIAGIQVNVKRGIRPPDKI